MRRVCARAQPLPLFVSKPRSLRRPTRLKDLAREVTSVALTSGTKKDDDDDPGDGKEAEAPPDDDGDETKENR